MLAAGLPSLLPLSPPSLSESRCTYPWVTLLAGFDPFSSLIWTGWSVFQIAEAWEGFVTETRSASGCKCFRRSTSQILLQALENGVQGQLGLACGWKQTRRERWPGTWCADSWLGLSSTELMWLELVGREALEPAGPSAWRRAAVVHFQCAGLKVLNDLKCVRFKFYFNSCFCT